MITSYGKSIHKFYDGTEVFLNEKINSWIVVFGTEYFKAYEHVVISLPIKSDTELHFTDPAFVASCAFWTPGTIITGKRAWKDRNDHLHTIERCNTLINEIEELLAA